MKLYFIRHAATKSNLSGMMSQNYDKSHIIDFDPSDWNKRIGRYIKKVDRKDLLILTSPTLRCRETAVKLFGNQCEPMNASCVAEFECKGLGRKKFWEVSEQEFEKLVPLTSASMKQRIESMIDIMGITASLTGRKSAIIISHGMYIRYLYHWIKGHYDISPYDVINSKGFAFSNLDMLEYDTTTHEVHVHRYSKPITRK